MNHNQFDYEEDLIYPLKEFLRRHTGFKTNETFAINIPENMYETPPYIKEAIYNMRNKVKSGFSCFEPCFGENKK